MNKQVKMYKQTKNRKKIVEYFKKEINEISLICNKKKKLNNPFIAFKYLLYIPIWSIGSILIITFILLATFFIGVWNAKGTTKGEYKKCGDTLMKN